MWTRTVLPRHFYAPYINFHSFIHSFIHSYHFYEWNGNWFWASIQQWRLYQLCLCSCQIIIFYNQYKVKNRLYLAAVAYSFRSFISSLYALVQSAGFWLKTQPGLLLLPTFFHGLTTATVSSWVHLILSSNLSRKFRTLLQDLFSWHPVTTTQHLSWKNCTGFPFQNVLSIKSLVCVSVL